MCSIVCRNSKSKTCKCECKGLFHGILFYTPGEKIEHLKRTFPPCTPVRFHPPTKRGTTKGVIRDFHLSKRFFHPRIWLASGECVSIDQVDTIGEK